MSSLNGLKTVGKHSSQGKQLAASSRRKVSRGAGKMQILLRVDYFSSPQNQNMAMNGARVNLMVHAFR